MRIEAIIIDGFHKGHSLSMNYHPTVKLYKPKVMRVDVCCNGSEQLEMDDIIEYKECFRGVDRRIVLYSVRGESSDIHGIFDGYVLAKSPWNEGTTLYRGFHGEVLPNPSDKSS